MRKYEIKDIEAYRNRKPRGKGKNNLPESEKQKYVTKAVCIPVQEVEEIMKMVSDSGKSFSMYCLDMLRENVRKLNH